ncbi:MAG: hypothetical protein K1X89_10630 [Myxococcaceae bacterium]|nr:hypothetical protein [Myxococcaceae bacterium]
MRHLAAVVLLSTAAVSHAGVPSAHLLPQHLVSDSADGSLALVGDDTPKKPTGWTFGQKLALGLGIGAGAAALAGLVVWLVVSSIRLDLRILSGPLL